MKKLSREMKTFANSVVARAEAREGMMAVLAVAVITASVAAEILSRRKRNDSRATSIGCDPEAFRRRLAGTLSNIPATETELTGATGS
jgi:hypothetical protein